MIVTNLNYLICTTTLLYIISVVGLVLNQKNMLTIIMEIDLNLLAINLFITNLHKRNAMLEILEKLSKKAWKKKNSVCRLTV